MKKSIVLIGSPGSGKDTQVTLLAEKLGIIPIKTGEMARQLAKKDQSIASVLKKGEFINNDIINDLVRAKLDKLASSQTFISDAFPLDIEQALWLDKYLAKIDRKLDMAIFLDVSSDEAICRMKKRARKTDTPEVIDKRLADFNNVTAKVIDYYKKNNLLIRINGEGNIEKINQDIRRAILGNEN
ncbi:MAG: nucleoside monophosphate kinase [bacterium]|nr:nucleoside monophosphate kinase [bacterium]